MNTPSILQKIIATKHQEIANDKTHTSLDALKEQIATAPTPRGFARALRNFSGKIGVISEIKKASPSKGIICQNFNPVHTAQAYEQAGATCLSVLTDRIYFQGCNQDLINAKKASRLPILRKDFMVDDYHIYQSRALGADCILLIMACLNDDTLAWLHHTATTLGMDVLIEMHNEQELERALKLPKSVHTIYGINNRNLNTFDVDLNTSVRLANLLRDELGADALIVSESGIHSKDDIHLMQTHGIHRFLIGEQFMKTDHAGKALSNLLNAI